MTCRGRFAPSPTGSLHFGSLVAAVGSWLDARARAGAWLVRIEDIDPPREVPGSAEDIVATLAAFGMQPDEPVVFQSARTPAYQAAFEQLQRLDRVFPCWCSRSDLAASSGVHRGACIAPRNARRRPAWRVRAPAVDVAFDDAVLGRQSRNLAADGDFVVLRADGWFAYQLAVVVDDAHQAVTDVVRGADLAESTPRQIHLQQLLGLPTPRYAHLPLVVDRHGRKLSKQDRAHPVDRDDPLPALRSALAFLGMADVARATAATPRELLESAATRFDLAAIRSVTRATPGRRPAM
jgi:glutamyl-Q tRNA(Asp) synthetase